MHVALPSTFCHETWILKYNKQNKRYKVLNQIEYKRLQETCLCLWVLQKLLLCRLFWFIFYRNTMHGNTKASSKFNCQNWHFGDLILRIIISGKEKFTENDSKIIKWIKYAEITSNTTNQPQNTRKLINNIPSVYNNH